MAPADRVAGRLMATPNRAGREQTAAAPDGCAIDVPSIGEGAEGLAEIIPLTRALPGREGGIRTRDLSVPNAGHGVYPQPGQWAETQVNTHFYRPAGTAATPC
jgi:hypothetical protein